MRFLAILARNTLAGVLFFVSMWALSVMPQGDPVDRPYPVGAPNHVMDRCVEPVEGRLPTGVVLQRIGGSPDIWAGAYIVRNPRAVDRGLDVALEGAKWKGMRVLDFCK